MMAPVLVAQIWMAVWLMAGAQDQIPVPEAVASASFEPSDEGEQDGGEQDEGEEGADEADAADMAAPAGTVASFTTQATQPVSVEAYSRHYEPPPSEAEARYDAGIENTKRTRQNQLQTLEGAWQVYDAAHRPLIHFIFRTTGSGASRRIEGAWRREGGGAGVDRSGFIDSVIEAGPELEISYFPSRPSAPDILHLRRAQDGVWHGTLMTPEGEAFAVTLIPSP